MIIAASITISPQVSITVRVEPTWSANIVISPQVSMGIVSGAVGDGDATIPMLTLFDEAFLNVDSVGYALIPMLLLVAEGGFGANGDANLGMPGLTLDTAVLIDEIGEAVLNSPALRLLTETSVDVLGNASLVFPAFVLRASETATGEIGTIAITLPALRLLGEIVEGGLGAGAIAIPRVVLSAVGLLSVEGVAAFTIPALELFAKLAPSNYQNMVMNLHNNALSNYLNYPFNSFCRFNGVSLGATATGVFNLDSGTTDDNAPLSWSLRTGYLDLEMKVKHKVHQAWIKYKSSEDIIVTIVQPNGEQYEYPLSSVGTTESGIRVKFGKGIKSKYVALDLSSGLSGNFTLDSIRLNLDQFMKKR